MLKTYHVVKQRTCSCWQRPYFASQDRLQGPRFAGQQHRGGPKSSRSSPRHGSEKVAETDELRTTISHFVE